MGDEDSIMHPILNSVSLLNNNIYMYLNVIGPVKYSEILVKVKFNIITRTKAPSQYILSILTDEFGDTMYGGTKFILGYKVLTDTNIPLNDSLIFANNIFNNTTALMSTNTYKTTEYEYTKVIQSYHLFCEVDIKILNN